MKYWYFLLLLVPLMAACSSSRAPEETPLPTRLQAHFLEDLSLAPELNNEIWLNTDQPLRLANLRGKVVLLEMWTFG